jgi:hypothetical protein
MAISVVQVVSNATASGTGVTATISAATAGNRLICFGAFNGPVANLGGPSGFAQLDAIQASSLGSAIGLYEKLAAGGETSVAITTPAAKASQIVVYEVSGITKGTLSRDVVMDAFQTSAGQVALTLGQSPILGDAAGDTQYVNEFSCQAVALNGASGGAIVSITGGYTSDASPGANILYASSQIFSGLTALFAKSVTTWTTGRANQTGIIASFRGSDTDPTIVPDRISSKRLYVRYSNRKRIVQRIYPAAEGHPRNFMAMRSRRPQLRRARRDFFQTSKFQTVPPSDIIHTRIRPRVYHLRRGLIVSFVPTSAPTIPPGIVLELIRARQRPRFKYTQRHGLFVYPIPPQTPPISDPIVIEPIRGFLLSDGKTSGLLVTDGHTFGVLLSDGKTFTVLIT